MKYSIRKNWVATFDLIRSHPVLLLPFVFIAFFETIVLELIYFSTRPPLAIITTPIIKKFFGEAYLHYPAHIVMAPSVFYYLQVVIYVFVGVFLTAIAVNIFKNIGEGLPVKANALIRNAAKRYGAFVLYGVIFMVLMAVIQPVDKFIFSKVFRVIQKIIPGTPSQIGSFGFSAFLFLTNFLLQILFIASVPFMVLEKKSLFKAILSGMGLFFRNIPVIIGLTALPFLLYLPVVALKGATGKLIDVSFPEIVIIVTLVGSVVSIFIDSFMMISVCRFIADKAKIEGKAR